MWFIGVEVEKETSAAPPKKNPGSAPAVSHDCFVCSGFNTSHQQCHILFLDFVP